MDAHVGSLTGEADPPTVGELLKRLIEDTGHLFRSELKRAQAEFSANIAKAVSPLLLVMFGGLLLLGGLFTLLGALVAWLTPLVGAGWAAFIVAVGASGIGVALVLSGKKQLAATGIMPTRVAQALRDDVEAFKGHGS